MNPLFHGHNIRSLRKECNSRALRKDWESSEFNSEIVNEFNSAQWAQRSQGAHSQPGLASIPFGFPSRPAYMVRKIALLDRQILRRR